MSRILLVTVDAGGNVPPFLAIARSLAARLGVTELNGQRESRRFAFLLARRRHWRHSHVSTVDRAATVRREFQCD